MRVSSSAVQHRRKKNREWPFWLRAALSTTFVVLFLQLFRNLLTDKRDNKTNNNMMAQSYAEEEEIMDWEATTSTTSSESSSALIEPGTTTTSSSIQRPLTILQKWTDPLPPQVPGTVRCVVLSDTHGLHWNLPQPLPRGDVLIHLGDAANRGSIDDIRSFSDFVRKHHDQFPDVILIEGNHDRDKEYPDRLDLAKEYQNVGRLVRDEVVQVAQGRISVLGVSWDACESHDFDRAKQSAKGQRIDMLLTHCPPSSRRIKAMNKFSQSLGAALHLSGHIHRRRGILPIDSKNTTISINCSSIPANRPVVLDWDPQNKRVVMIHCPCPGVA